MENQKYPYDRFRQLASFLCGYLSVPNEKSSDDRFIEDLARTIRRYANIEKPLHLSYCKKCNKDVELEFYEPDDECSEPHYYCPKCYSNYFDKNAKEPHKELDNWREDMEEDRQERELEYKLERAASCVCGAYQIIGHVDPVQVADCVCGAG